MPPTLSLSLPPMSPGTFMSNRMLKFQWLNPFSSARNKQFSTACVGQAPPGAGHICDLHSHHFIEKGAEAGRGSIEPRAVRPVGAVTATCPSMTDHVRTQQRSCKMAMELKDSLCRVTSRPLNHRSACSHVWVADTAINYPMAPPE